jgi:hypothetical protein
MILARKKINEEIKMFENLKQEELFQIFANDINDPKLDNLINSLNTDSEKENFLEHCVFLYWKRKIGSMLFIVGNQI